MRKLDLKVSMLIFFPTISIFALFPKEIAQIFTDIIGFQIKISDLLVFLIVFVVVLFKLTKFPEINR